MEFIYDGNSLKSGTYKLTNKLNGRIYVGSCKEFKERWKAHEWSLKNHKHSNRFLQADFDKCGTETFIFEIIEIIQGENKQLRLNAEQILLNEHWDGGKQCYNLSKDATNPMGGRKFSKKTLQKKSLATKKMWEDPEYRAKRTEQIKETSKDPDYLKKLSNAHKGKELSEEHKKNLALSKVGQLNPMYGKTKEQHHRYGIEHTEESKQKMSEAHKGMLAGENHPFYGKHHTEESNRKNSDSHKGKVPWMKGKTHTEEARKKMSNALKGKPSWNKGKHFSNEVKEKMALAKRKKVLQFTLDDIFLKEFASILEASVELNINRRDISNCCKGRLKSAGGFKWSYKNE